jgi:hypothetical protein
MTDEADWVRHLLPTEGGTHPDSFTPFSSGPEELTWDAWCRVDVSEAEEKIEEDCSCTTEECFQGGKFINVSPVLVNTSPGTTLPRWREFPLPDDDEALLLFGTGKYRDSAVYLAWVPLEHVQHKDQYRYFSGYNYDPVGTIVSPGWSDSEEDAVPVALEAYQNPSVDGSATWVGDVCENFEILLKGAGELSVTLHKFYGEEPIFIMAYTGLLDRVSEGVNHPGIEFMYTKDGLPWAWTKLEVWSDYDSTDPCNGGLYDVRCNTADFPFGQYGPYFAHGLVDRSSDRQLHSFYHMASTWLGDVIEAPYAAESRKLTLRKTFVSKIWEVWTTQRVASMSEPIPGLGPEMREIMSNASDSMMLSRMADAADARTSNIGFVLANYDADMADWTEEWFVGAEEDQTLWWSNVDDMRMEVTSHEAAESCSNPLPNEGCRSIGAGMRSGLAMVPDTDVDARAVIVLTDGPDDMVETPGYETVWEVLEDYPQYESSSPDMQYHVVALGMGTDDQSLYDLSSFSAGSFHKSWSMLDLPEIYQTVEVDVHGMSAIETYVDAEEHHVFEVAPQDHALRITLSRNSIVDPLDRELTLISPPNMFGDRQFITSTEENASWAESDGAIAVQVNQPRAGLWRVQETSGGNPVPASMGPERVLSVSTKSSLSFASNLVDRQNYAGQLVSIFLDLSNGGEHIEGATFEADISYVDGVDPDQDIIPPGGEDVVDGVSVIPIAGEGYLLTFTAPVAGTYTVRMTAYFERYGNTYARKDRLSFPVMAFDVGGEINDAATLVYAANAVLDADGVSATTVTLELTNFLDEGVTGRDVFFTTTHGSFSGDVVDHGDGTYTQTFVSGTEAGTARIGAAVASADGNSMFRVANLAEIELVPGAADAASTVLGLSSGIDFLYREQSDVLQAECVDVNGNPCDGSQDVVFYFIEANGAVLDGAVEYKGDGVYEQAVLSPATYTYTTVGVRMNGADSGQSLVLPVLDYPAWSRDCDGDGFPDAGHGQKCRIGAEWWAPLGEHTCDMDSSSLVCGAPGAALVDEGAYARPGVTAFDVDGDYIYVTRGQRVEVLEPGGWCWGPRRLGEEYLGVLTRDIDVSGGLAYVATHNGISVVDVADPAMPGEITEIPHDFPVVSLEIHDGMLLAVDGYDLSVYSLADPVMPDLKASVDLFECNCPLECLLRATLGAKHPLDVDLNRAVVGDESTLVVVDLGDPYEPVVASYYDAAGVIDGVRLWDRRAYISGDAMDELVDVRIAGTPELVGTHDLREWVMGAEWNGDRAYKVEFTFLQEVDLDIVE